MRGGEIVGIGTQGCVFSPKLVKHTRKNGSIIAKRSNNIRYVSKVFTNRNVFDKETGIINVIARMTKGIGVIIPSLHEDASDFAANALNSQNYALLNAEPSPPAPSACMDTKHALNMHKKIYIMTQPRILGDIRQLKTKQPLSFFSDAYTALLLFKKYHIRHRDMYARNIFYNEDNALIGDFGHAVDLTNLDHPKSHYSAETFKTKQDLADFIKAIKPYVRISEENHTVLRQAIKDNNFYLFYDMANVPRKYIESEVRDYLDTFPTDETYTPPSPKLRRYSIKSASTSKRTVKHRGGFMIGETEQDESMVIRNLMNRLDATTNVQPRRRIMFQIAQFLRYSQHLVRKENFRQNAIRKLQEMLELPHIYPEFINMVTAALERLRAM